MNLLVAALGLSLIGPAASAAETVTYAYDDAGRLTNAAYGGGANIAYAYDAAGNLLMRTVTEGGATTYTLIYRAGAGGRIEGVATQEVAAGASGSAVTAVVEDGGAVFARWSDGVTAPGRTDADVQEDLTVQAAFRSTGGADLDWYAARGIAPEGGEDWAAVDARAVPGKGTTLRDENFADTEPDDTNDVFRVISIDPGPPVTVTFRPGAIGRVYRFVATDDLIDATWTNVPGIGLRPGQGEGPDRQDTITDPNDPPAGPYYRLEVEWPE